MQKHFSSVVDHESFTASAINMFGVTESSNPNANYSLVGVFLDSLESTNSCTRDIKSKYLKICDVCKRSYTPKQSFCNHKSKCKASSVSVEISSTKLSDVRRINKCVNDDEVDLLGRVISSSEVNYPRTCELCMKSCSCKHHFPSIKEILVSLILMRLKL
ncbi:hypothetical protein X975_15979, partial [Stegodyphus mimosarum]